MRLRRHRDLYWNYADCEGNNHNWVYTYTIEYEDFTMPPDAGSTVECFSDVVIPVPPVVYDNCGMLITPTGPSVENLCRLRRHRDLYLNYADCEGNTTTGVYTYTIEYETSPCRLMPDRPSNASAMW